MSTTKRTIEVDVDVTDVECDECSKPAENAFCAKCLETVRDEAGDRAIENYSPPRDETCADNAAAVRGWLTAERLKPSTDITPEIADLFERCAEDLEVGN